MKHKTVSIPFKESIDLLNLPIVTFTNGDTKLHFLLDTGSDDSYVNNSILGKVHIKKAFNINREIVTGGNSIKGSTVVVFDINYINRSFENSFIVSDFTEAFNKIARDTGIEIHGILGSIFFNKYKYVLDFMNLKAYVK